MIVLRMLSLSVRDASNFGRFFSEVCIKESLLMLQGFIEV